MAGEINDILNLFAGLDGNPEIDAIEQALYDQAFQTVGQIVFNDPSACAQSDQTGACQGLIENAIQNARENSESSFAYEQRYGSHKDQLQGGVFDLKDPAHKQYIFSEKFESALQRMIQAYFNSSPLNPAESDLVFTTRSGASFNLKDVFHKHKPVMLVLWDPECGHCQEALPFIEDIQRTGDLSDITILTLTFASGGGFETTLEKIGLSGCRLPILLDPQRQSLKLGHNIGMVFPQIFLFSENGEVITSHLQLDPDRGVEYFLSSTRDYVPQPTAPEQADSISPAKQKTRRARKDTD